MKPNRLCHLSYLLLRNTVSTFFVILFYLLLLLLNNADSSKATAGTSGNTSKRNRTDDAEPESDKGKVRYIRTLEEGLVREMSYVPKEGGGNKQLDGKSSKAGGGKGKGKEKKDKDY